MTVSRFKIIILAAGLSACVFSPCPSYAGQKEDARRDEIKAVLAAKQAERDALAKKAQQINSEVKDIKTKLVDTSAGLRKTEEALSTSDQKLKNLKEKKVYYLQSLYKDQDALGGWVTAAGRYKRTSTPQLLVQSAPLDAARASLIMKTTIPLLQQRSGLVRTQLDAIAKIESDIARQMNMQSKEYKEIDSQQKELAGLLKDRQDIYKKTESARLQQEKELGQLAQEAKSLEDLVLKIKKKNKKDDDSLPTAAIPLPANMIAPVEGTIQVLFGGKTDTGAPSKGITFNARPGATVVTPLAGVVRFAGPFQRYRQILIVEHRGGYHSLIAGLGSVDTVVGDNLAAGEPVGKADEAPAAVYYELRRNGDPIDPRRMLTAKR